MSKPESQQTLGQASAPQTPGAALQTGDFVGREDFRQRVREVLTHAGEAGWRELVLSDASFVDWPLGERAVVDALTHWVLQWGGQRLTLLACRYDEMQRQHPLFVRWRRQWSHKIEARIVRHADPTDLPSAILAPTWALQRLEPQRFAGICGPEPERGQLLRQQIDEWLQRSSPGFAATTLGL